MHPAAGLHRHELRAAIEEDFKAIPGVLEKARQSSTSAAAPNQEDNTPPPEQLTLF
jgi:hypothetical protein